MRELLAIYKNASFVGEFGSGCNSKAIKHTNNPYSTRKWGTISLSTEIAYKENRGRNDSALHSELVKSMKKK